MGKRNSFGLAAGLVDDLDCAKADALPLPAIERLLTAYRGGDDESGRLLQSGLRHIPYSILSNLNNLPPGVAWEDLLGSAFVDFGDCIKRLRNNDVAPDGVESYIRADLFHVLTHFMSEESATIHASDSTNCERRKRGAEPYLDLHKEPAVIQPDPRSPELRDYLHAPPGYDDDDDDLSSNLWTVANSPIEKEIAGYLCDGKGRDEIADLLGVSVYRVRKIIARLKARLDK